MHKYVFWSVLETVSIKLIMETLIINNNEVNLKFFP